MLYCTDHERELIRSSVHGHSQAARLYANVIMRDAWIDTLTTLGVQAGYEHLRVASHRHRDQNSFRYDSERGISNGWNS